VERRMIEQLISRVFYARNLAHYEHFRTKSYAQHKALGKFYDAVIGALDPLVEAHQGVNGIIGSIPAPEDIKSDILKTLKGDAEWIEKNHEGDLSVAIAHSQTSSITSLASISPPSTNLKT
jgi:hypothetical protein